MCITSLVSNSKRIHVQKLKNKKSPDIITPFCRHSVKVKRFDSQELVLTQRVLCKTLLTSVKTKSSDPISHYDRRSPNSGPYDTLYNVTCPTVGVVSY